MKKLFFILIVLFGSVYLGLYLTGEPGSLVMSIKDWTVEMPLWIGGVLLLLFYLVLNFFFNILSWVTHLGENFGRWMERRKLRRARKLTQRGLIELTEGDWHTAEKDLLSGASNNEEPLLNYLAAARAAQEQGSFERRDAYLSKAQSIMPDAKLAVELTQAQLQISNGQIEQALSSLKHLHQLEPKHPYVLKLLKKIYFKLSDWRSLHAILPAIEKAGGMEDEELQNLKIAVYTGLINDAAKNKDYESLHDVWQSIPRKHHKNPIVLEHYAKNLICIGAEQEAESLLRYYLKHQWHDELVELYGLTKAAKTNKQLNLAESWLKKHPQNSSLYLCLGRICMQLQLWGKAKTYLEKSIELKPSSAAYADLGKLLETLGEYDSAAKSYKQGLMLQAV